MDDAETVAWAWIDHHQHAVEYHAELTDLVRRARADGVEAAAKVAADSWEKDRATGPTIANRILALLK